MVNTAEEDERHLNLLSIFHYVVGGMTALFACFPIIHFVIGILWIASAFTSAPEGGPHPTLIGVFFVVFAGTFILAGWTLAGFIIYAGRCLAKQRRHTLCLVVAGVECIFMPFGTVLGALSIVVLTRPSVKAMFES